VKVAWKLALGTGSSNLQFIIRPLDHVNLRSLSRLRGKCRRLAYPGAGVGRPCGFPLEIDRGAMVQGVHAGRCDRGYSLSFVLVDRFLLVLIVRSRLSWALAGVCQWCYAGGAAFCETDLAPDASVRPACRIALHRLLEGPACRSAVHLNRDIPAIASSRVWLFHPVSLRKCNISGARPGRCLCRQRFGGRKGTSFFFMTTALITFSYISLPRHFEITGEAGLRNCADSTCSPRASWGGVFHHPILRMSAVIRLCKTDSGKWPGGTHYRNDRGQAGAEYRPYARSNPKLR